MLDIAKLKACAERGSVDRYLLPGEFTGEQLDILQPASWRVADPDEYLARKYCMRWGESDDGQQILWFEFWNWPKQQLIARVDITILSERIDIIPFSIYRMEDAIKCWTRFVKCAVGMITFTLPKEVKL